MAEFDTSYENLVHNDEEEAQDLNYVNAVPLIRKDEWGGMNPSEKEMEMMKFQETPVDSVVLAYNTGMLPRTTKQECITAMQELQLRHMENGEPDICYNFMICGDGNVYEGRGWDFGHSPRLAYPVEYGETVAIGMFGDISQDENGVTSVHPNIVVPAIKFVDIIYRDKKIKDLFAIKTHDEEIVWDTNAQPSEEDEHKEERPPVYRKTPLVKFLRGAFEKDLVKDLETVYNDYSNMVLGENEFYTREDRPIPSDLSEPDDDEIQKALDSSDYIDDSLSDEDADDEDDGEQDVPEQLETDVEQEEKDELGSDLILEDMTKEEEELFKKRIYFDDNQSHLSSDEIYSGYETCASFSIYSERSEVETKEPVKHTYNKRKK